MDIKSFTGDESRAEGVWIPHHDDPNTQFKLTYVGENNYRDYIAQKFARARKGRTFIAAPKERAIILDAIIKFLLKDWKGITKDGEEYPFNHENARKLLFDSPALRDFIVFEADNIENFGGGEAEEEDDEEGKVSTPVEQTKSGAPVAASVG